MFWCMPSTFMLDWAIWSLYWVLSLLLGVFTNFCCKTGCEKKTIIWIISKNKINRSINQLINQLFDKIIEQSINQSIINKDLLMTGGGKEKKEWGWGSEALLPSWVGRNGSITIVCMWLCVYSLCVCAFLCACLHLCTWTHARVCVCVCVCAVCQRNRK